MVGLIWIWCNVGLLWTFGFVAVWILLLVVLVGFAAWCFCLILRCIGGFSFWVFVLGCLLPVDLFDV